MSWLNTLASAAGSFFKTKTSSTSSVGGDLFKALLGGIGGSASAKLDLKMLVEKEKVSGLEQRKTSLFEQELLDYHKQNEKVRKRAALDTYGQFSQINRWAPNYVPRNPPIQAPAKPNPGG